MIAWRSWAVIQAEPRTGSAMTAVTPTGRSAVAAPIFAIFRPLEKNGLKWASPYVPLMPAGVKPGRPFPEDHSQKTIDRTGPLTDGNSDTRKVPYHRGRDP